MKKAAARAAAFLDGRHLHAPFFKRDEPKRKFAPHQMTNLAKTEGGFMCELTAQNGGGYSKGIFPDALGNRLRKG